MQGYQKISGNLNTMVRDLVEHEFDVCLFVSRVGWIPGLAPVPPLPDGRVRICRDTHSREFPLHHYSGLGTRTK